MCRERIEIPNDLVQCVRKKTYLCQLGLRFILHSNHLGNGENLTSHDQVVVNNLETIENNMNKGYIFSIEIGSLQILVFRIANSNDEDLWYGNGDYLNTNPPA